MTAKMREEIALKRRASDPRRLFISHQSTPSPLLIFDLPIGQLFSYFNRTGFYSEASLLYGHTEAFNGISLFFVFLIFCYQPVILWNRLKEPQTQKYVLSHLHSPVMKMIATVYIVLCVKENHYLPSVYSSRWDERKLAQKEFLLSIIIKVCRWATSNHSKVGK